MRPVALLSCLMLLFVGCSDPPQDNDNTFNVGQNQNQNNDNNDDPGDICDAWDAGGGGMCDMVIGFGYDGSECVSLGSGCGCSGADCDKVHYSMEGCQKQVRDCDNHCGDPDADICDEYGRFDPQSCPDDSAYTVVDCQPVCVEPDSCEVVDEVCPTPDDGYQYTSNDAAECEALDIDCGPDAEPFYNDCGCGCHNIEPDCPDPDADDVQYFNDDPEHCPEPGQEYFECGDDEIFNDDCGCGCIAESGDYACDIDDCPEGMYCRYEDDTCGLDGADGQCQFHLDDCTDDTAEVCGCDGEFHVGSSSCAPEQNGVDRIDDTDYCLPDDCPNPDADGVYYGGFTGEYCSLMDFPNCEEDQDPFDDECGCGCIDQP